MSSRLRTLWTSATEWAREPEPRMTREELMAAHRRAEEEWARVPRLVRNAPLAAGVVAFVFALLAAGDWWLALLVAMVASPVVGWSASFWWRRQDASSRARDDEASWGP